MFCLCGELQGKEGKWFSNYVNINQFKKTIAKFYVMWRDIYLRETAAPDLLFVAFRHN